MNPTALNQVPPPRRDSTPSRSTGSSTDPTFGDALKQAQQKQGDGDASADPSAQADPSGQPANGGAPDPTDGRTTTSAGGTKKGTTAKGNKIKPDANADPAADPVAVETNDAELAVGAAKDATKNPQKKGAPKGTPATADPTVAAATPQPTAIAKPTPEKKVPGKPEVTPATGTAAAPAPRKDDPTGDASEGQPVSSDSTGVGDETAATATATEPTAVTATKLKTTKAKTKAASDQGSTDPADATSANPAQAAAQTFAGPAPGADDDSDSPAATAVEANTVDPGPDGDPSQVLSSPTPASATAANSSSQSTVSAKPTVPQFVESNHSKIVTAVAGQLMPDGGTMQIRLDPPELGAVQVTIHLKNGVVSAAFEAGTDDGVRMISHSLGQLKASLEASGVAVEKMHVQQAPKQEKSGDGESDSRSSKQQDARQENKRDQQRQELLKKMWQKLSGGDPLDLVA